MKIRAYNLIITTTKDDPEGKTAFDAILSVLEDLSVSDRIYDYDFDLDSDYTHYLNETEKEENDD